MLAPIIYYYIPFSFTHIDSLSFDLITTDIRKYRNNEQCEFIDTNGPSHIRTYGKEYMREDHQ